jgi:hypothetical protein
MQDDFVVQAAQSESLARQQKKLEAQAKAIAQQQARMQEQAKVERERARRLNNKQFARWLDNSAWAIRVWCAESRVLWSIVLLHWVLFVPVGLLAIRTGTSDECLQNPQCRAVVRAVIKQPKSKQ